MIEVLAFQKGGLERKRRLFPVRVSEAGRQVAGGHGLGPFSIRVHFSLDIVFLVYTYSLSPFSYTLFYFPLVVLRINPTESPLKAETLHPSLSESTVPSTERS